MLTRALRVLPAFVLFCWAATAAAQDADGDGVLDPQDVCPTTPTGYTVDLAGCDAFCEVVDVTTDVFLRSRLLEVGTADAGSFGSTVAAPTGWHPRPEYGATAGFLGFVADPAGTGWLDYKGDFFVPGTPEEGFGLSVAGVTYFNAGLLGEEAIAGTISGTRVECLPTVCGLRGGGSVTWSGSVVGIDVEQTYSVLNEGLFILIEVKLVNTTGAAQVVTYLRNVDPDNMEPVTGDYTTTNTIVSQGDGSLTSLAHVQATTSAPDSYIALISQDPDARVITGGFTNRDADAVWACTDPSFLCATGANRFADEAISLAVRKTIPAGDSVTFTIAYMLDPVSLATASSCTVPSVCGDGVVEGTESCDDGALVAGDGCDATCNLEPGWACTGAPSICTTVCGDGLAVGGEPCDDGNTSNQDACLNSCVPASCGDGFVQTGAEACDDGNTSETDACLTTCVAASCGDGFVQTGAEACDDGNPTNEDACLATCVAASCGDGFVQTGVEACDDGNASDDDACLTICVAATCGDGFVQTGVEACDDGNASDDDACLTTCVAASCGDGFVQAGVEACDDGNASDEDACLVTCAAASCGDGFVQTGVEGCDDGNASDEDACLSTCVSATCGDGFVQDGVEVCDDGNASNADGCLASCLAASCGDGFVQSGVEACDDGNASDEDACLSTCVAASCGDGFVQSGVEACDDGNDVDGDACTNACALPTCGDGIVQDGEACDDGNDVAGDGCAACMVETTPDAGPGPGADAGVGSPDDGGCGCRVAEGPRSAAYGPIGLLALAGLLFTMRRRRR